MLTGLDLMIMGVTQSNSGLFSTPGFVVSPVGKRGMGARKKTRRREGGTKEIEKEERKEGGKKE